MGRVGGVGRSPTPTGCPGTQSRWSAGKDLSLHAAASRAGARGRLRPHGGPPVPAHRAVQALAPRPRPGVLRLRPARGAGVLRPGGRFCGVAELSDRIGWERHERDLRRRPAGRAGALGRGRRPGPRLHEDSRSRSLPRAAARRGRRGAGRGGDGLARRRRGARRPGAGDATTSTSRRSRRLPRALRAATCRRTARGARRAPAAPPTARSSTSRPDRRAGRRRSPRSTAARRSS